MKVDQTALSQAMAKTKHKTIHLITLSLLILVTVLIISDSFTLLINDPLSIVHSSNGHRSRRLKTTSSLSSGQAPNSTATSLKHVVFGIGSSADQWERRKHYVKFWWRPHRTRGFVWVDKEPEPDSNDTGYPALKVSEDTSRFAYTNQWGPRSGLRMTRIVSEMARMGLRDVRWFVMGDDDTIFFPDNLVRVLNKYDHTQMYYIGSNSETHVQNLHFSYGMAYGGGGFAMSYPLAMELERMQDRCIQKYGGLYGSDDRIHACLAELGVPLTKEPGFHQFDILGNPFGILSAHPVAPLLSLHHLDIVNPIFPSSTRAESLDKLSKPASLDSAALMQQSICYDTSRNWTVSVSWGYVVQIIRGIIPPREIEKPARTFSDWFSKDDDDAFSFNTRPLVRHPCQKPRVFFLDDAEINAKASTTNTRYVLHNETQLWCWWDTPDPKTILSVEVYKKPDPRLWNKAPRRNCCRVLPSSKDDTMVIGVGACRQGEVIEAKWN